MYFTPIWLLVILEATSVSVINVHGAFYDLSEVMDEDDSLLMPRSAGGRSFGGRFREQMAQLQPTDTSKTTRASLFLPGTGILGSSQPARTILVTPAASSGALTATAACCPCTGATSGALIAPVGPGVGRLTAATGGFGWPSGFSSGFTSLPALSTFPTVSGQLIAPLYLSSPQQQLPQQQQIQQSNQQQQMINQQTGQTSRLGFSSSDDGQVESLADGKRKTRRLSSHSRTQVG